MKCRPTGYFHPQFRFPALFDKLSHSPATLPVSGPPALMADRFVKLASVSLRSSGRPAVQLRAR